MAQMMIEEAKRYNTTVENLIESGFVWLSDAYGDCHWFANTEFGTLMSLAWFRKQQEGIKERLNNMRNRK